MFDSLDSVDRLRLMKLVCSFAWADYDLSDEERKVIKDLVSLLDLDRVERAQVDGWLEDPPSLLEFEADEVPAEHRQLFIDTAKTLATSDGQSDDERQDLALLKLLLR